LENIFFVPLVVVYVLMMKEDFLHYVWHYKKFDFLNLKTVCNKKISIIDTGVYTQHSGADFFNAQLKIDNVHWAGNVEIHLKSSDWYVHNHHRDTNYDNVILHVVWDYDVDVYRRNNTEIPVLQLKDYIQKDVNRSYMDLAKNKSWLFCEKQIERVDKNLFSLWKEQLFTERLAQKSTIIEQLLQENKNDWEETLFCMLSKNFGLNTNGNSFFEIAKSIPFSIVRKEAFDIENLEALFFGKANFLDAKFEDNYPKNLQNRWNYLQIKYQIEKTFFERLEFFRHRPDNFPTIRLAQLAMLYHSNTNFFDTIINSNSITELRRFFNTTTSDYWKTHYVLDKESRYKKKLLSKNFVDLLIINTIIPFRFAYNRYFKNNSDVALREIAKSIQPEKNTIIERFKSLGIKSKNAFDSQALLQLKKYYCDHKQCMQCKVGKSIIG